MAVGQRPWVQRGFTLLELMVVTALIAVTVGMATLALRDADANRLEEEGARLAALFEGARARARAEGSEVLWQPNRETGEGFVFTGLPPDAGLPSKFLDERTRAEIIGAPVLRLGPEPVIGAQRVVLRIEQRQLVLATDGLGPFVVIFPEPS
ncbi:prepilin-type N-terminal cleavage/methylation domain-containing protein [Ideonella sp.]|uniref:pilus assembly FimT family protein n=1 Tax=Ideonella sp. TaxID=1929293 RepID=UPI002B47482F|nr:prepilin-type N-terminal cleavage/methylation domain-containing protein [Ideonella sp.]HJV70667.1 prepilin-type N-terminal cleavage/methylation domain-containing protein [Ideonella sp.]